MTIERHASCACGKVRYRAAGKPIVSAVCYCADCQAGGRAMEDAGARPDFRDAWGGTGYLTYRDDRLVCEAGAQLLKGYKLSDGAPTTRYVATCCNSAILLKFSGGFWTSMMRVRFGAEAPALEMRNKIDRAAHPDQIPRDVPAHRGFPPKLIARLVGSGIGVLLARLTGGA